MSGSADDGNGNDGDADAELATEGAALVDAETEAVFFEQPTASSANSTGAQ